MKKTKLSIVVLSFNTKKLLRDCLLSLKKIRTEVRFEVFIPDNGSTDGSVDMVEKDFPWVRKVLKNGINLGFAAGNNKVKNFISSEYVLFLNSDTVVYEKTLSKIIKYMDENRSVGAATCKVIMKNGKLDKDTRRSFINPWIGLTHIYLKLDRIFPNSKLFSKYWYGYISEDKIHEVDAIQGAFFLTRKKILDEVGWFDEEYFLDGEDIDLSWKIRNKGYKIMYYPKVSILHLKGASKGKNKKINNVSLHEKLKYRMAGVNSMELFFKKRLWKKYPLLINLFVLAGIRLLKIFRIIKVIILG